MSILLDKVRNYFFNSHLKINSGLALLAFMPLFAVAFSSNTISEGSVLNGIKTHVKVGCDGQIHSVDTYASTVGQALEGTPCALGENDLVEPLADTKLDGNPLDVSVAKATPVTIVDGDKVTMTKSAYKDSREILKQVGIKVHPEDDIRAELIVSDFYKNGLGQKIIINRAPAVMLEADGNILEVRTHTKTVEDFLKEKGITLGSKDEVSPSLQTRVIGGMKITVVRVSEKDITEDVVVPYATVNKRDNNIYQGQTRVESEGMNGQKKVTSKVIYRNGAEASRTILAEEVLKSPQNRVVIIGAKPYGAGDLWALMVEAGARYGVDPGAMYRVMMCESGGNVNSVNWAGYKGLFQWDGSYYKWTAIAGVPADYFNPRSQIFATAARVSATGGWRAWSCKP